MTNYVNKRQTKEERRAKYQFLKTAGIPQQQRRKMRDWTIQHICQYITANKKLINKWKKESAKRK